ncbi:MAG: biopolymer transporter ExbD [Treponema sp.]|nr:biopolymer transporter ExbD [Treponema sp.]
MTRKRFLRAGLRAPPAAALSDVAFLLLIFVMVLSLMSQMARAEQSAGVIPAEARQASEALETGLEIWIDAQGEIFVDGRPSSIAEARDAITALSQERPGTTAMIVADRDARFGAVSAVIEMLQSIEHRNVSLAVRGLGPSS